MGISQINWGQACVTLGREAAALTAFDYVLAEMFFRAVGCIRGVDDAFFARWQRKSPTISHTRENGSALAMIIPPSTSCVPWSCWQNRSTRDCWCLAAAFFQIRTLVCGFDVCHTFFSHCLTMPGRRK